MGSLADLRLPTAKIEVPNTEASFEVRGLSLADISALMETHGQALNGIYVEQIGDADGNLDAGHIAQTLMRTAPSAVSAIICIAAGEPEAEETVAQLPVPVQVEALVQIARLTFHSEEALGNLIATVISAASSTTGALNRLNEQPTSTAGSGDSAA